MKHMFWSVYCICLSVGGAVNSMEPMTIPVLVGPGSVSTDAREFATSVSPDGDLIVAAALAGGRP